jgi:hypothetical protein
MWAPANLDSLPVGTTVHEQGEICVASTALGDLIENFAGMEALIVIARSVATTQTLYFVIVVREW